jgi:hypothetical protein
VDGDRGSLTTGRDGQPATLPPNGRVLIAGGYNGSYLSSAEMYDPKTARCYRLRLVQP